jgi:hypothetical protein
MPRWLRGTSASWKPSTASRGPVVVDADHTGSVDICSRLSKHFGLRFEVFDDVDDADHWLVQRAHRTTSLRR